MITVYDVLVVAAGVELRRVEEDEPRGATMAVDLRSVSDTAPHHRAGVVASPVDHSGTVVELDTGSNDASARNATDVSVAVKLEAAHLDDAVVVEDEDRDHEDRDTAGDVK